VVANGSRAEDEHEREPEAGRMLRPEARVLGEEAVIPDEHVIRPPPNRFTHELRADEPYRFDMSGRPGETHGVLARGTPVLLLREEGDRSRVVDGAGVYVEVPSSSLEAISPG
jgi:hypothetical protein